VQLTVKAQTWSFNVSFEKESCKTSFEVFDILAEESQVHRNVLCHFGKILVSTEVRHKLEKKQVI
jgi:hypothetical protein